MKAHTRSAINKLALLGLLVGLAAAINARAANALPSRQSLPENSYRLSLTLLPDFSTNRIDVVGQFAGNVKCDAVVLEWYQRLRESDDEPLVEKTDPNGCAFRINQIGNITVKKAGDEYWLNLPIEFPRGIRTEKPERENKDSLYIAVLGADVLPEETSSLAAVRPSPDNAVTWTVYTSLSHLPIAIHPWKFETTMSLTPIVMPELRDQLKASPLVSGTVKVSSIRDVRSYYMFVRPDSLHGFAAADLLSAKLDNSPRSTESTYPGFSAFDYYSNLANQVGQPPFLVETTFVSHQASPDKPGEYEFTLNFSGGRSIVDEAPRPAAATPQPNEQLRETVFVHLGPEDTLTVSLPNTFNLQASMPPNERPGTDSLLYKGPGHFPLTIVYTPLPALRLQQTLFNIRAIFTYVENWVAAGLTPAGVLPIVVICIVCALLLTDSLRSKLSHRVPQSVTRLLTLVSGLKLVVFVTFMTLTVLTLLIRGLMLLLFVPIPWLILAVLGCVAGVSVLSDWLTGKAPSAASRISVKFSQTIIAFRRWSYFSLVSEAVIWFVAGIVLLYGTASVSSLLILAILALIPRIRRWKELLVNLAVLVLVVLDNYWTIQSPLFDQSTGIHIGQSTANVMFVALAILITYYYWAWITRRAVEALDISHLPVFMFYLLIFSTYDVINNSLISLILIISLVTATRWWADRTIDKADKMVPPSLPPAPNTTAAGKPQIESQAQLPGLELVAEAQLVNPPPAPGVAAVESPQTATKPVADNPAVWLHHLRIILEQPLILIVIVFLLLVVLRFMNDSLNGPVATILTLCVVPLLFAMLYDFLPGSHAYIKVLVFTVALMFIFLTGIGTASVTQGIRYHVLVPATDNQFVKDTFSPIGRYALFLNQLGELLVGRIIFYTTVPLFVSLFIEFEKNYPKDGQEGDAQSPIRFGDIMSFLGNAKSFITLGVGVLSIFLPKLLSSQPIINTITELLQSFQNFSGLGH